MMNERVHFSNYDTRPYIERALERQKHQRAARLAAEKEREIKTTKLIVKCFIYALAIIAYTLFTFILATYVAKTVNEDQALLTPMFALPIFLPFVYLDYYVQNIIDKYTKK